LRSGISKTGWQKKGGGACGGGYPPEDETASCGRRPDFAAESFSGFGVPNSSKGIWGGRREKRYERRIAVKRRLQSKGEGLSKTTEERIDMLGPDVLLALPPVKEL